jgi:hypothetical protein
MERGEHWLTDRHGGTVIVELGTLQRRPGE